jgi:hypothetical protein
MKKMLLQMTSGFLQLESNIVMVGLKNSKEEKKHLFSTVSLIELSVSQDIAAMSSFDRKITKTR